MLQRHNKTIYYKDKKDKRKENFYKDNFQKINFIKIKIKTLYYIDLKIYLCEFNNFLGVIIIELKMIPKYFFNHKS